MVGEDELDALSKKGVNHVLLTQFTRDGETKWQASIGRRAEKGYIVEVATDPALAMFAALQRAGVEGWVHPSPLQRLGNALDRAILARWSASS